MPPYQAKSVANIFLEWADTEGREITNLKLQKLLFFSHADYLVANQRPLLCDEFEAWSYGPVIPSVYQEFKHYVDKPIQGRAFRFNPATGSRELPRQNFSPEDRAQLRRSYEMYVLVGAGHLSQKSHKADGPWARALALFEQHSNINRRISNELILACYGKADA